MRPLKSSILLFVGAAVVAPSAMGAAGADAWTVTLNAVSPQVTYSTPDTTSGGKTSAGLTAYLGYSVQIKNGSGNTINNVKFTVKAKTTAAAAGFNEPVVLNDPSELPSACVATPDRTEFNCAVGQLKAGASFPGTAPFLVFYKAPQRDQSPANSFANGEIVDNTCKANTDCVLTQMNLTFAEGTNDTQFPVQNSQVIVDAGPVALGTANPILVKSALPKSGGSFFTGATASPTPGVPIATSAKVDPLGSPLPSPTVTIEQDIDSVNCQGVPSSGQISKCQVSAITIPDLTYTDATAGWLTIKLRLDASRIAANPFKIDKVSLYYIDSSGNSSRIDNVLCDGFGTSSAVPKALDPLVPAETPCIANRVYYKNKSVTGWTQELDGDAEWTIYVLKNGSYKVF